MAYPPVIPPSTRANNTPELDNHPGDHNALATALANMPWGRVASVVLTANGQTGIGGVADLTGATVTFTAIAGRRYRIGFSIVVSQITAQGTFNVTLATAANAVLTQPGSTCLANAYVALSYAYETTVLPAGATTLKLRLQTSNNTINVLQGVANPTLFYVDDIGPAV